MGGKEAAPAGGADPESALNPIDARLIDGAVGKRGRFELKGTGGLPYGEKDAAL